MAKIFCPHHQEKILNPAMIHFGNSSLGTKQYICAVCSSVRELGTGRIVSLKGQYGFIGGPKDNFFFHFKDLGHGFTPSLGLVVSFEVVFLEDGRIQAVSVRQAHGGDNGY